MSRRKLDQDSPLVGRFDQSFLIHMIRDFFVILLAVTVLEFALKAGLVYYKFTVNGPRDVSGLATDFSQWIADMRLTALLAFGKIVLDSVLLFLILRARLEPLLGLRAVVSNLARANGGLTHRAEIRTADEFGVLARDLNLFLDRITRLMQELADVLARVVSVNADIVKIQGDLRDRLKRAMTEMTRLEERMEGIITTGSVLVQRIRPSGTTKG